MSRNGSYLRNQDGGHCDFVVKCDKVDGLSSVHRYSIGLL